MKRGSWILIAISLLVVAFVIVTLSSPDIIRFSGAVTTSLQNESSPYDLYDLVRVNLSITDVTNLSGIQVNVSYGASVLTYINVTEGEFLNENGNVSTYFNNSEIVNSSGQLRYIIIFRLGEDDGATGNGTLASIYFNATGSGISTVGITSAILSNNTGGVITSTIQNTTVNVSGGGGGDTTIPKWARNSTNGTGAGTWALHSVNWTDETALSGYIFEFDNGTGTLANSSFVTFSGTQNWSNVTKYVNETVGSTVRWRVFTNDSSNNRNSTSLFTYTTTDVRAPHTWINSTTTTQGSLNVSFTTTAADNVALNMCFYFVTNSTGGTEKINTTITCNSNPQYVVVSAYATYTLHFFANDSSGNLNSTNTNFTTSESSGTTTIIGGGGGGGGGGLTVNETKTTNEAVPDKAVVFTDFHAGTSIKQIEFWVHNETTGIGLNTLAYGTSFPPTITERKGQVYNYLRITTNLGDNIRNATVTFQVAKTWLTENELNDNDLALFRFGEKSRNWDRLDTNVLEGDESYSYYQIEATGFSYFAIAEKTGIFSGISGNLSLFIIIGVIVIVIIVLGAVLYKRRRGSSMQSV